MNKRKSHRGAFILPSIHFMVPLAALG
jgi:hypothetical protein